MDDIRFKNLYDAFLSHIDFSNYMESYSEEYVDLSKINYNLLIAVFSGFYLTAVVDEYICKEKEVRLKFVPEFLDNIVKIIATKHGSGWRLNELSYKDSSAVIDKIRNKLAHGDFIVDSNEIIFEEKGLKGKINVDDLIRFISHIDNGIRFYKEEGLSTTINANLKYIQDRKVYKESSLKRFCKDLILIFIDDEPLPGTVRNIKYIENVKYIKQNIIEIFKEDNHSDERIKKYLESQKELMDLYGIKINYKITSIYDLEYYQQIKDYYFETNEYSKDLYGKYLAGYLLNKVLKLSKGQYQTFNASKGIILDLYILQTFRENPNISLLDIPKENPKLSSIFLSDIDNAILATYIVGFNSFYQFGLEKGLTEKGKYDLSKLVKNETLDFSKLDLDLLDDPNMSIEHKFETYHGDIKKYEDKNEELLNSIIKIKSDLENYIKYTKEEDINEDKIKIFTERYYEAIAKHQDNISLVFAMKNFKKTFDFDKYVRNINIIEHIRNAIAHGNIYIDEYNHSKDFENKTLVIKDFDKNNNLGYYKEVAIIQFASLFKMKNFIELYNFISSNITNRELLDETYIDRLNDRINKRVRKNI